MDKKFVMGIAAMAALTLVSCSSDDLDSLSDNSSKNEAISFDGYLGRSAVAVNGSRGGVLEIADLQKSTEGFGVFGNYKEANDQEFGANLFDNQQVTYKNSEWTYSPHKYWLPQGHIDFLAYAPYVKDTKLTGSSIDFTVENEVAKQKDLLYAKAAGQTMADNSGAKKVKFQFEHALSRLGYSVKLKKDCSSDATITLKKIILAGSSTEPTTGSSTESTGAFYTNGTINLATGNWSSHSGKPAIFTNKVSKQLTPNFEQGKAYMINLTIGRPIEFDADVTPWTNTTDNKNTDINIDSWDVIR